MCTVFAHIIDNTHRSTEDLHSWSGPSKALTLPMNETVPNVGVSLVADSDWQLHNLPKHQAFMALETSRSIAINTGKCVHTCVSVCV